MPGELRIDFKNLDRSAAVEADIKHYADKLDEFCNRIIGCNVVVERPHSHHRNGRLYQVRIDLTLPGHELVVNRHSDQAHQHEDVHVAVRDSFNAMRRQVEEAVRKDHGHVKTHVEPARARVNQVFPLEDYGFLVTPDGREVYFHRNAVLNGGFEKIDIGSEVEFAETAGDRGPQASTVRVVKP